MEKLELKHVAPYLPYGLKVLYWNGDADSYVQTLSGLTYGLKSVLGSDKHKLILRPLSDLTKEITHNGETFVPMDVLFDLFAQTDLLDFDIDEILNQPYQIIQKLLEWHFDISGLIKKGLAIDINTLER